MPTYTYPGVYVEEIPSGVRTIAGVSTSDTAFIDCFKRGPMNQAVRVTGMEDFTRKFGGLHRPSEASYALRQYYLNGGQVAWVVRVASGMPVAAALTLAPVGSPAAGSLTLEAASPGVWGLALEAGVDHNARDATNEFNLVVREVTVEAGTRRVVNTEVHRNLSMNLNSPRFVRDAVNEASELVVVTNVGAGPRPATTGADVTSPAIVADPSPTPNPFRAFGQGQTPAVSDGNPPDSAALVGGLSALEHIAPHIFNILCLPAVANLNEAGMDTVITAATKFCTDKRAFLIVDPHGGTDSLADLSTWMRDHGDALRSKNAAFYFPRALVRDPLNEDRPRLVGPSGTMAGVYARTDAQRGVWKAPAGTDARLQGVTLEASLTDLENGGVNPLGINVLRTFPVFGNVAWGARTLDGADQQASEWKYVPVRRTALYIEESLYQALKWVVFEGNDETLWSQIRLNVGAFMNDLFRQGAFQGATPAEAYFVKCDEETTTQTDVDRGIVNILVGFAPLKPAEFVVIKIQQIAGQIET
ncbi:MAG: phage tail sheath family protein [Actinomycetota bacterium]|nr:phage tail sheath family protein [Actinomycetota bacterium]